VRCGMKPHELVASCSVLYPLGLPSPLLCRLTACVGGLCRGPVRSTREPTARNEPTMGVSARRCRPEHHFVDAGPWTIPLN
jgi:hypothetical protein